MRTKTEQNNRLLNNARNEHMNKDRKDFSSLKRNLFTEFNSISNIDDNIKKDTVDEIANSSIVMHESKPVSPIKEEQKSNLLEWMSPIHNYSLKYHHSIGNSLTPTPIKVSGFYENKEWVPPYPIFNEHYQKWMNLNNFPPFLSIIKDRFSPQHHRIMDSQTIQDEFCGK